MARFTWRTPLPFAAEDVFSWHARPGAFERLTPPWEDVRLLRHEGIRDGQQAVFEVARGPVRRRWVAVHRDYVPGRGFADVQLKGPFSSWKHTHRFEPDGQSASVLADEIDYRLPAGAVGGAIAGRYTQRSLERTFAFRHRRTLGDLARHAANRGGPLRIAITGASGLIGRNLKAFLTTGGHRVDRIVLRTPGHLDASSLEGVDAVVHLAGEPIPGRWTRVKKAKILTSRVEGTRLLAETLATLERKPSVLVCASAVGYYGDRGDETLTEESAPGDDFLAHVVQGWEAAAEPARAAGVRVVSLRQGVILGAILPRLRTAFGFGLGGPIGDGRQFWSWVGLDDVIGAYHHAIVTAELSGPINVVAPTPVRNAELARTLGRVLRRPAVAALPAGVARLGLGEVADAVALASQRVSPAQLLATGFEFRYADLEDALRHELGR